METKFQTSFIPKKPLLAQESTRVHSSTNLLMVAGVFLFSLSIGAVIFTFAAKQLLLQAQARSQINLAENEKRFNLPLIEDLKKANMKIDLANQLLKNHVAVSEALAIVEGLTAEKIRFSNFEFSSGSANTPTTISQQSNSAASPNTPGSVLTSQNPTGITYKIKMKGIADSFNSVAFQSDVFGRSGRYGTNKVLKNPVLSDLTVDEKGNIVFNFGADITLADISYEKFLSSVIQTEN